MSALAAARTNLANKGPIFFTLGIKAAASQTVYNGALAMVNTAGKLVPGATTAGCRVVGVVDLGTKNSVVTALDDVITVKAGIFAFANGSSSDTCTDADNLNDVYVLDDQTVSRAPGAGRPIAGQLIKIEGGLCYVAIGVRLPNHANAKGAGTTYQGDGSVEAISAAGALSVSTAISTLAITGTTAYTLANGLFPGQRKTVICISAGSTPNGTITPATPSGFATVTTIGAQGESVELIWTGAAWVIASSFGCTFT